MFEQVQPAPPDAILGLSEAFALDRNSDKINLAVGVYKDEHGRTPVLECVKEAERRILANETSKGYRPIEGSPDYAARVQRLLLGEGHALLDARRVATAHTPGGTGALRVAGDYLAANHSRPTVWLSEPTWPNHPSIFEAAGLSLQRYAYFHPQRNTLDFRAMLADLQRVDRGDVVLLHGCCHNPTGVDPTLDQWREIASVLAERGALPLIDFAYQGLGDGLDEDAAGLRALLDVVDEAVICSSFSKNFGLYNERVGAMTVVAASSDAADAVLSQVKTVIRRNYSNPPAHGGSIIATIFADESLTQAWHHELAAMRERINTMRAALTRGLDGRGVQLSPEGNAFIERQRGMFTMTGLTRLQVQQLRDRHAIYVVGSGRINVAGLTPANLPRLCDALAAVMT